MTPLLKFRGKAGTLEALCGRVKSASLLPQYVVSHAEIADPGRLVASIVGQCGPGPFMVRSTSISEDSEFGSSAGAYLSVGSVPEQELLSAITQVFASYGASSNLTASDEAAEEVLVQPMLDGTVASGVVFSHDQVSGAPYRTFSWHEGSNTSVVTGGLGGSTTWREADRRPRLTPAPWPVDLVRPLALEMLELFALPVDLEFAITRHDDSFTLWVLQVRQLHLQADPESAEQQHRRLSRIESFVENRLNPKAFIAGSRSALGVMPDWNPAEMIGIRPRPLALSLYQDLITDSVWAYQRHNYGYRNLRGNPLLISLDGQPFVDVRLSLNSFVPAVLNDALAGKLVDYYMGQLEARPELHDKIEFEVVFSCYSLDLPKRLTALVDAGFSEGEIAEIAMALKELTNQVIHPEDGLWIQDAAKLRTLSERQEVTANSSAPALERLYWTIEDVRRYGTLPFAGLARAGFIGIQMLRSLAAVGVISPSEEEDFLLGVSTVGKQMAMDRLHMKRDQFLARYGHLRPGTYDITSPRYDKEPDRYFDWEESRSEPAGANRAESQFGLSLDQLLSLRSKLAAEELNVDPVDLLAFIKHSIELREWAKFEFTRSLSYAIELIAEVGGDYGFTRSQMSYCSLRDLLQLHTSSEPVAPAIQRSISRGEAAYRDTALLSLPHLILAPSDVWGFRQADVLANFITSKSVTARVCNGLDRHSVEGSIVVIESADPGFDWIFPLKPAGLITAWGGANSHMAIRAAEVGIPAAIGVGDERFMRIAQANRVLLDAATGRLEIVD